LRVVQLASPAPGVYRTRFQPARGPDELLFFLKRPPAKVGIAFQYNAADPFAPLRVEVTGLPKRAAGKPWEAHLDLTDPRGVRKPEEHPLPLRTRADGALTGEVDVSRAADGPVNLRLRLRDPDSGWETDHSQRLTFDPQAIAVRVALVPKGIGRTGTGPRASI